MHFKKLQTEIKILSNHNILNYHMEKCGLAITPYCDYCTDVMKEIDANWDIKCLETSCHILCKCKYFSEQRAALYYNFKTYENEIFSKNMTQNLVKMINFFDKTKIFERPIKLTKNMLSPYKNKGKRKKPEEGHNNTQETKKKKSNTNNQLEKYFPIIIN